MLVRGCLACVGLAGCELVFGLHPPRDEDRDTDAAVADAVPMVDAPVPCPPSYIPAGSTTTRYRFVDGATTWQIAEADCEDDLSPASTHLVVFDGGLNELDAVQTEGDLHLIAGWQAWAGYARDAATNPNQFYAVTGESLVAGDPLWNPMEPDNGGGTADEAAVAFHAMSELFDAIPIAPNRYICECDHRPVTRAFTH